MIDDDSNSAKPTGEKKKIIKLTILGAILVTIFLAFFLPYRVSNGVENFSGKEAEVAQKIIGDGSYDGPSASPIPNLAIAFKAKVTHVQKRLPQKACSFSNSTSSGVTKGFIYDFEIDRVTFFGILAPGWGAYTCVAE